MTVTLQLLDSAMGHPIQVWTFKATQTIRIGRADTNDIVIADPLVSRHHVELLRKDGHWEAVSQGLHGTLVDGKLVEASAQLGDISLLRLGANGPLFEFRQTPMPSSISVATATIDTSWLSKLRIDEEKRQQEVEEIAASEAFKELQQQAQKLRQRASLNKISVPETKEI